MGGVHKPLALYSNLAYGLIQVGYVAQDCTAAAGRLTVYDSNWLSVLLGVLYIWDACIFVLALWKHDRQWCKGWGLAGELGFVLSALLYAISQMLYYLPSDTLELARQAIIVQAAVQLVACFVYVVDSLIYLKAYLDWRKVGRRSWYEASSSMLWEFDFWAEFFNILPSIGYVGTSIFQMARAVELTQSETSIPVLINAMDDVNITALTINIIFDICYVFDAFLYIIVWAREASEAGHTPSNAVVSAVPQQLKHTHVGAHPPIERDILEDGF